MTAEGPDYTDPLMSAIEFTTELTGGATLTIPPDVAARLPKSGAARIVVLTADDPAAHDDAAGWQSAAYGQFFRDDTDDDAIYDTLG